MRARATGLALLFIQCGCAQIAGLEERKARDEKASAYRDAVMADGPKAYFRFGEGDGDLVKDEVGGRVGTIGGGLVLGAKGALAADPDTAVELDGATATIDFGDAFDLPNLEPFSIELWISATSAAGFPRIANKAIGQPPGEREGYEIWLDPTERKLFLSRFRGLNSDAVHTPVGAPLPLGQFVHAVFTGDQTRMQIFVNGAYANKDELESTGFQDVSAPLVFGEKNDGTGRFAGMLDEFAFYDYELSTERIEEHYRIGSEP